MEANVIIEILTFILVVITAIYAYLTFRMAKASEASVEAIKDQSQAILRPYIIIAPFIRPHTTLIYLRIKNTGQTNAKNLQLTLDHDFFQFGEKIDPHRNLRTMSAFSLPIASFPPGAELIFALAQGSDILGKESNSETTPVQFSITANYEFFGKLVNEINEIDLRPYIGSTIEVNPIVEELERIRKTLEKQKNI